MYRWAATVHLWHRSSVMTPIIAFCSFLEKCQKENPNFSGGCPSGQFKFVPLLSFLSYLCKAYVSPRLQARRPLRAFFMLFVFRGSGASLASAFPRCHSNVVMRSKPILRNAYELRIQSSHKKFLWQNKYKINHIATSKCWA